MTDTTHGIVVDPETGVIVTYRTIASDGPLTLREYFFISDETGRQAIRYGVRCWDCRWETDLLDTRDPAETLMYNHQH